MPFSLLGSLTVTDDAGRSVAVHGRKARALLALLLTRANAHIATDQLEDELWDGAPPPGARSTLQAHVCRLRSAVRATGGAATICGGSGGYMLQVADDQIDVCRFESTVAEASTMLNADPRRASDLFAEALDQWHGPALQDVRHVPALALEAHRLDELHLTAIEGRMAAELATGGHVMAIGVLQRLVADHPYREHLQGLLMLALYRSGRQVEALRCFQSAREALAEIGVQPGHELRALEASIIGEDPALDLDAPVGGSFVERTRRIVLVDGPDARDAVEKIVGEAISSGARVLRARARPKCTRPYHAIADALAPLVAEIVDPARRRSL